MQNYKVLLLAIVMIGFFGIIGYVKYVKQNVSPTQTINLQTSNIFRNLITNKTLPAKGTPLTYTKINAQNGYSFEYRNDLFDSPNAKMSDLKSGQDNGYTLYYKGTRMTFLMISVQDNSLETISNTSINGGKYLSGIINGHESRTQVITGPNLYGKFLGSITTFIDIDKGKKTLLVYAYPVHEVDITYYNEILNSLIFN